MIIYVHVHYKVLIFLFAQINFVGEGAIDHGGPRREFFRLFAQKVEEDFFQGSDGNKYFVQNIAAVHCSVHVKCNVCVANIHVCNGCFTGW